MGLLDTLMGNQPLPEPSAQPTEASFSDFLKSPQAMALASSLLQSGGWQAQPTTMGQALGQGMDAMRQAGAQDLQQKYMKGMLEQVGYKNKQAEQEMQARQEMADLMGQKGATPENAQMFMTAESQAPRGLLGGQLSMDEYKAKTAGLLFKQGKAKEALAMLGGGGKQTSLQQNLLAAGLQPGTPEYQKAVLANVMKPGVSISTGSSYNIPQGYMLKDPNNPSLGVTPIPGGNKDAATPEAAGKIQMQRSAQKQLNTVKSLMFNKDGTSNSKNIVNSQKILGFSGTPGTTGRTMRTAMEQGIQAITRLETGAAMPASEVDNTRERFMPTPFDTEEAKKLKFDMFSDFINGSLKLVDPSGRFDEERFQTELAKRSGQSPQASNTTATPAASTPGAAPTIRKFNPATGRIE